MQSMHSVSSRLKCKALSTQLLKTVKHCTDIPSPHPLLFFTNGAALNSDSASVRWSHLLLILPIKENSSPRSGLSEAGTYLPVGARVLKVRSKSLRSFETWILMNVYVTGHYVLIEPIYSL